MAEDYESKTKKPADPAAPEKAQEADRRDPLTDEELRALVDEITGAAEFTLRDKEYGRMRELVHGESEVVIPGVDIPKATQWHSPEINTDGHLYVRRMMGASMSVHVTAMKEGRRAETSASRIKDYLAYLDADWRARGIYQPALFDVATLGVGVLHPIIRPDALPDPPPADKDESYASYMNRLKAAVNAYKGCPFDLERIDARTLYWEADGSVQFQKAEVPVRAINRIYATRKKSVVKEDGKAHVRELPASQGTHSDEPTRRNDTVTLISLEDEHWCYRLVYGDSAKDAEVLDCYPNYFGEPSYVRVLGDLTGRPDALNFSQPWLLGKYATVRPKNLFGTVLLTGGLRSAQQRYQLRWIGKGEPPANVGVEDIRVEGDVLVPPPGWEVTMPKIELGVDVTEALRYIESIDTYGFPREIAHPMEMDAKSGFDRAKATDAVSSLLDAPLERWAEAMRKVFLLVLRAQGKLELTLKVSSARTSTRQPDHPIEVRDEIEVAPDELEEVDVSISYDATTQYTKIAQAEEHLKQRDLGLYTDTEFLKNDRGIEDTDAFFRLKDRDEMRIFSRTLGLEDAKTAISNIRAAVLKKAAARHKLADGLVDNAGGGDVMPTPDMGGMGGGEVTPSLPTGTSTAQPLTPPIPDELTQPGYTTT